MCGDGNSAEAFSAFHGIAGNYFLEDTMVTMFEVIAILFIGFLVGIIFYGYSLIMRRPPSNEELRSERCSICRQKFAKDDLVERPVGDYKLLYFCNRCIAGLGEEANNRPTKGGSDVGRLVDDAAEKHRTN